MGETKKILMETLRGRCYCGTIEFEVRATKPVLSIYCHCSDCRRAHGAPVYQMFLVQSSEFSVTKGHDSVKHNWMKPVWAETKCCSSRETILRINALRRVSRRLTRQSNYDLARCIQTHYALVLFRSDSRLIQMG